MGKQAEWYYSSNVKTTYLIVIKRGWNAYEGLIYDVNL